MTDNRGSAVAIVMMILGVVSLVGVALLTQSNLDLQFTSSLRSYDRMFHVADGASTIAYQDLRTFNRELPYSGTASTMTVPASDGSDLKRYELYPTWVDAQGKSFSPILTAEVTLGGYSTDPRASAGWELSRYYPEYWIGEGQGESYRQEWLSLLSNKRAGAYGGVTSEVHTAVRKMRSRE